VDADPAFDPSKCSREFLDVDCAIPGSLIASLFDCPLCSQLCTLTVPAGAEPPATQLRGGELVIWNCPTGTTVRSRGETDSHVLERARRILALRQGWGKDRESRDKAQKLLQQQEQRQGPLTAEDLDTIKHLKIGGLKFLVDSRKRAVRKENRAMASSLAGSGSSSSSSSSSHAPTQASVVQESQPQTQTESQSQSEMESQTESQSQSQTESKTESQSQPQTEPQPRAVSEPKYALFRKPPSVQWLFVDSLSVFDMKDKRMSETRKVLESNVNGAAEVFTFQGYMPIATATLPHLAAMLAGRPWANFATIFDADEHPPSAPAYLGWPRKFITKAEKLIFERLSQLGYGTAYTHEQCIDFGFDERPADHVLQKEYCLFARRLGYDPFFEDARCLWDKYSQDVALGQATALHRAYRDAEVPLMSFTLFLELHERTGRVTKLLDRSLAAHFARAVEEHPDTIFILSADHGSRYRIAGTDQDRFLPYLAMIVPKPLLGTLGDARVAALRANKERLVTAFDLHTTVLDLAGAPPLGGKGLSLLDPVPETRTCPEAGVSWEFCWDQRTQWSNSTEGRKEAEVLAEFINNSTPEDKCERIEISSVFLAVQSSSNNVQKKKTLFLSFDQRSTSSFFFFFF
jgi:hypothetical protein